MSLQRTDPIKRSSEDSPSSPSKRNLSPRNPSLYISPPSTPKRSTRSRSKIFTGLKNVFGTSKLISPVSDVELSQDDSCFSPFSEDTSSIQSPPSPDYKAFDSLQDDVSIISLNNSIAEDFRFQLSSLTLQYNEPHPIFTIPEILHKIIGYVDEYTSIPLEKSPSRRRPLSYQHALLIHNDEQKARKSWNLAQKSELMNHGNPETSFSNSNSLYNCLLVNKLWNQVTMEVITTKQFFVNENNWLNFVNLNKKLNNEKHKNGLVRSNSNTKLFVMHKLSRAKQEEVDIVARNISGSLEWIEMYICPKVLPTSMMLTGSMLKKLILPGSKVVNNSFLSLVAQNCPKLEILDLRACPLVSDEGMIKIGLHCPNLKSLNLGRHTKSELITDRSISIIASNSKLETLGLAGCSISDRGLWDLSIKCNDTLTRLSLNNCVLLTDHSLPRIISQGYLENLSVLEIRHIVNLAVLEPLVLFRRLKASRGSMVLIEGCERIEYRMREEEWKLDMKTSARMFNDIIQWVNDENDGDVPYSRLAKA